MLLATVATIVSCKGQVTSVDLCKLSSDPKHLEKERLKEKKKEAKRLNSLADYLVEDKIKEINNDLKAYARRYPEERTYLTRIAKSYQINLYTIMQTKISNDFVKRGFNINFKMLPLTKIIYHPVYKTNRTEHLGNHLEIRISWDCE